VRVSSFGAVEGDSKSKTQQRGFAFAVLCFSSPFGRTEQHRP
jgi:hypothetical protein